MDTLIDYPLHKVFTSNDIIKRHISFDTYKQLKAMQDDLHGTYNSVQDFIDMDAAYMIMDVVKKDAHYALMMPTPSNNSKTLKFTKYNVRFATDWIAAGLIFVFGWSQELNDYMNGDWVKGTYDFNYKHMVDAVKTYKNELKREK